MTTLHTSSILLSIFTNTINIRPTISFNSILWGKAFVVTFLTMFKCEFDPIRSVFYNYCWYQVRWKRDILIHCHWNIMHISTESVRLRRSNEGIFPQIALQISLVLNHCYPAENNIPLWDNSKIYGASLFWIIFLVCR